MDQHMRYVKAMQVCVLPKASIFTFLQSLGNISTIFLCFQDQASALAKGVYALQHQLQQLHFNDQDADKELQPIQDDVQRTSQDLSKYVISKPAECVMHHMSSVM